MPIQSKVVLRRAIGVFLMLVSIWLASCQALFHQFSRDGHDAERVPDKALSAAPQGGADT
ncbi:MAG: hypothetical protein U9R74_14915 [Pseudomonadota bacterium]|nr:hypothetical protein [Pseudomonadota bacterium]